MTGYAARTICLYWTCTLCVGCVGARGDVDTTKQEGVGTTMGQPNIIVVEGKAVTGPKHHTMLKLADGDVVTMESEWPKAVVGKHVRVTGIPERIENVPPPKESAGSGFPQMLSPGYIPMKALKIEVRVRGGTGWREVPLNRPAE